MATGLHRKVLVRSVTLTLAVLLSPPFTSVIAQGPPPLEPGQRVRVTCSTVSSRDCSYVGTLERLGADTLVLVTERHPLMADPATTVNLGLSSITKLEVYRGRQSLALYFGAIGAACGAGIGASYNNGGGAVVGGLAFGLGGLLMGALINWARWEEVPLDQIRVSFVPERGEGFGFALSVRF